MKVTRLMVAGLMIGCFGIGYSSARLLQTSPPPSPPFVGQAEVSDLIVRLKPFVKEPEGRWYRNGIELTFYGASVRLKLKMKNDDEYSGQSSTLSGAVAGLTKPSADIQHALEGWKAQ